MIMATIIANCVTIAIEPVNDEPEPSEYVYAALIYLAIYIAEFLIKIFESPLCYWKSSSNVFDFLIVAVSLLEKIVSTRVPIGVVARRYLRSIRALRALRIISFVRKLQVVFNALVDTIKNNAIHLLVLLFLVMFIFGVLGRYLFGVSGPQEVLDDWGSLPASLYSLWVMASSIHMAD